MEETIINLFWLLFGHFLADMPLQGEWLANNKGKEPLFMIGHCTIWTGIISLVLLMLGLFASWKILFLFIGHYLMDSLKCKAVKKIYDYLPIQYESPRRDRRVKVWVYIDQLFHLGQLLCVFYF